MLIKLERFQRALLVIAIWSAHLLAFGKEVIAVAAPQHIHLTNVILLSIGLMVAVCTMPYLMFLITTRQVKKANIIFVLTMSLGFFAFFSCYSALQLHNSSCWTLCFKSGMPYRVLR